MYQLYLGIHWYYLYVFCKSCRQPLPCHNDFIVHNDPPVCTWLLINITLWTCDGGVLPPPVGGVQAADPHAPPGSVPAAGGGAPPGVPPPRTSWLWKDPAGPGHSWGENTPSNSQK